jgi:hypothetical protein
MHRDGHALGTFVIAYSPDALLTREGCELADKPQVCAAWSLPTGESAENELLVGESSIAFATCSARSAQLSTPP